MRNFFTGENEMEMDLFNRRERAGGKWIAGRLKPWKVDIFQATPFFQLRDSVDRNYTQARLAPQNHKGQAKQMRHGKHGAFFFR